jgi:DNA-binding transcriptional regulator YhcF (GntR family)
MPIKEVEHEVSIQFHGKLPNRKITIVLTIDPIDSKNKTCAKNKTAVKESLFEYSSEETDSNEDSDEESKTSSRHKSFVTLSDSEEAFDLPITTTIKKKFVKGIINSDSSEEDSKSSIDKSYIKRHSTKKAAPSTKKAAPSTKKAAPSTKKAAPSTKKAAPSTKKAAPSTKKAAPSTKSKTTFTYRDYIIQGIRDMKNRNGSSRQALSKYVAANRSNFNKLLFNRALRELTDEGVVIAPKGSSGTFKEQALLLLQKEQKELSKDLALVSKRVQRSYGQKKSKTPTPKKIPTMRARGHSLSLERGRPGPFARGRSRSLARSSSRCLASKRPRSLVRSPSRSLVRSRSPSLARSRSPSPR